MRRLWNLRRGDVVKIRRGHLEGERGEVLEIQPRHGVLVLRILGKDLVERVPVRACWWRSGV